MLDDNRSGLRGEFREAAAFIKQSEQMRNNYLKIQSLNLAQEQVSVQPIIFEECYVLSEEKAFVDMVKKSSELTDIKIREQFAPPNKQIKPSLNPPGVHLFVLVHGF